MGLLLKNADYLNWKTLELTHGNFFVTTGEEGSITKLTDTSSLSPDTVIIDCTGTLVTKSFVVGHHHAYSALSRGMPPPAETPVNFLEILRNIWWRLDKCLNKEMVEASALVTAIACARAGSAFVIDHHASPSAVRGSLTTIARAFERVGISHLLCYEISDRDGEATALAGLEETGEYLADHQGLVGLHASFTIGDTTLRKAAEMMEKTKSGVHIHVAEDEYDQNHCLREHGMRVVERLERSGVLNSPMTLLVHCLHLNDHERKIISNSAAWVVQNSESNLNNRVGLFSASGMGDRIIMGTDGMHSDMLRAAKASYFTGQLCGSTTPDEIYHRLRNADNYLELNNIKGNRDNNLVVLDYDPPTPLTSANFYGHFIYGIDSTSVRDVIANGRLVVRDRKTVNVDEQEILESARAMAAQLWKAMAAIR